MVVQNKNAKRKSGGDRKPSKPDYNLSAIFQNQMDVAVALYDKEEHPFLQPIADELDLNLIKVRKILITTGVYFTAETDSNGLSIGAERIRRMRKRSKILEKLSAEQSEETLWEAAGRQTKDSRWYPGSDLNLWNVL